MLANGRHAYHHQDPWLGARLAAEGRPPRLLLAVRGAREAASLREALRAAAFPPFHAEAVHRLSDAERLVREGEVDLVLLDLRLPEGGGRAFARLHGAAPGVAVVVLAGLAHEAAAAETIRHGAQDYLVREQLTPQHLARALRCALERNRHLLALRDLSLTDPLTRLHNRRGFWVLAEAQLKWVRRTRQPLVILCADLDGLKEINDRHGHAAGDRALVEVARALRACLRESDIVARVGGDEFAALAREAGNRNVETLVARVRTALRPAAGAPERPYRLSLSMGAAEYDGRRETTLGELMTRADQALYRDKRHHRAGRGTRQPVPVG